MQSFRTELENPIVEKDILELERKISEFKNGKIAEDKFRSLRLARGVYGQRQQGVQMIRIKIPFGKVSAKQLTKIADISDEYSNGKLHLTTRQDIQIHHVSLDKTPELWAKLEQDDITLREACGNTVRNVTASPIAGIDPDEPFDVSPYANAVFAYFLRKGFCQELGRKIKISFSSSDKDSAFSFIHDLGFIPKLKSEHGTSQRGFKVLVGGGLGAQPFLAKVAHEFLPEDRLIPFTEAALRVFERNGERNSRHKARLKYLLAKIGIENFLELVKEEENALLVKAFVVDTSFDQAQIGARRCDTSFKVPESDGFLRWKKSNVFEQKQKGFFGVYIKVQLGNIQTDDAREFAKIASVFAADDIRITINQGFLLKYVSSDCLPELYRALNRIGLAEPGFDSVADITACPGTDTCNLAISNSTDLSVEFERVITKEFPDLVFNNDIKIKISGCMNACGQHSLAQIGFHGSSFKANGVVIPALQLLLGGGVLGNGEGRIGDKIIKVPTKKGPELLRIIFTDYEDHSTEGEYFNSYYDRKGKDYFYQLLKPLASTESLAPNDFIDWGSEVKFETAIGVGECAGVLIDLVQTLIFEAEEKLLLAEEAHAQGSFGDSIFFSYAAFIHSAKALLLDKQVHCNTQQGIIDDFDKHFVSVNEFHLNETFSELVLQIKLNEPSRKFSSSYKRQAAEFVEKAKGFRKPNNKIEEITK